MKVLNLYTGIGGNRKLWEDVEVTAVENNPEIAKIYQDFFPDDKVIVADAHQYLLEHFDEFEFIWSSRPCVTHSRARYWASKGNKYRPLFPDMKLYEEIIFLKHYFKGRWVVENVKPYYKPLIEAQEIGRHLFWTNFDIKDFSKQNFPKDSIIELQKFLVINISKYKLSIRKDRILRNCVHPELGLHIFKCAFNKKKKVL